VTGGQWAPIPGWTGYEIHTTTGAVRSVPRTIPDGRGGTRRLAGRLLAQCGPYGVVCLSSRGRAATFAQDRLLKMAAANG